MIARKDGIWETTQETAWSLIALTDWMVVTGELEGSYDYGVRLNGITLDEGHVTPEHVDESIKLGVDIADLLSEIGNRLTIWRGPGEGRLYYTAHLKVYLPVEEIEPLDRGSSWSASTYRSIVRSEKRAGRWITSPWGRRWECD